MKAVNIKGGKGNADALFIDPNVPDPKAVRDRVVVRIKAFGLNRMDIMQRDGVYPLVLFEESGDILGVEFSGLVEELGPDCKSDFKKGDRVFGLVYGSAYAEKISIREKMLMHIPPNTSFETAAGIPETFYTAIQAVVLVGNLQKGQTILIHAGASGVGVSAIQIAKLAGASKIITTAGTDEKCALCKSLGADVAVNYKTTDFAPIVEKETGGAGVNVIVDLVGRDYWHRNIASATLEARLVIVAAISGGVVDNFSIPALMKKRMSVHTTSLRNRDADYQNKLTELFVDMCMKGFADGSVKIPIDEVFPWERVADAHRKMEANLNAGKIICAVD